jgi:magnesium transporter
MERSSEAANSATHEGDKIGTQPPRTRAWRDGKLEAKGFPVADISEYLKSDDMVVWLDLCGPHAQELRVISEELGLDEVAIEDAVSRHERAKLDRYPGYLFLNAYDVRLDTASGRLSTTEVSAFITDRAFVTIQQDDLFDVDELIRRWDADTGQAEHGVAHLLHGLLDMLVDRHFTAVQALDEKLEDLEDLLFDEKTSDQAMQRYSFQLRKSLVLLRRVVLPMREVVNTLLRRDLHVVPSAMTPLYQDLYDHVLRATEWTESLRDLVATIQETRIALQGNRLNEVMKKLTSWAAIIAVPTAVTGFYGMNVPYPGMSHHSGFVACVIILLVTSAGLFGIFKWRDWI